jgi:hypothetical protein
MLLQAFYGIRSERQLTERMEFDLLFRWFVGLGVDDPAWDHSSFSKNRDRLLEGEIARKFLTAVVSQPKVKRLLSGDHFSVDGTLLEAWRRSRASGARTGMTTTPRDRAAMPSGASIRRSARAGRTAARPTPRPVFKKGDGQPAKLCYMGHALMEGIAMVWWSVAPPPWRPAWPSARRR